MTKKSLKITYENNSSQKLSGPFAFSVSPAKVYLDSLGEGSRRAMRGALAQIATLLNSGTAADPLAVAWHKLDRSDMVALHSALASRYAPATVNKMLAALRGVLRECWRLELMDAETMHRITDLRSVPGDTVPAGRALTQGEVNALLRVCSSDPRSQGSRDAAVLGLLIGCGLRRAEVCRLDLADYAAGHVLIQGKRNKQRTGYLPPGAQAALCDWLDIRGEEPGPLFYRINKGGRVIPHRLSEQAVYEILWRRAEAAQIVRTSPHDCRRTFISNLLDNGVDIVTVQKMAGHSSVATTARYDRRPEEAKRKAARTLHIPYRRKKS